MNKSSPAPLEKRAIKMRKEMADVEKRMGRFVAAGHSKDHVAEVVMDGYHHVKHIDIDPEWNGDKEVLCDTLTEAFNDACEQIDNEYDLEISSIVSHYTNDDEGY